MINNDLSGNFFLCKQSDILKNYNFVFETTDPEFNGVLSKININSFELESFLEINQGIITGNDSEFLSLKRLSEEWKPTLRGRDIEAYKTDYPALYVYYSKTHLACPRTVDLFDVDEKLVMRRTSDFPVVSYDDKRTFNLHTLYSCRKKGEISIKFLLALLNSRLIRFVYLQRMGTEAGRIFAEIKILYIRKLPIKIPADQNPFITLVDQILTAKKADPHADTSALEKQIDEMVYHLYELTEDEIKIIEGSK